MWARRLIVGSSLAVASLVMVPGIAGATPSCIPAGSVTEPAGCVTTPTVTGSTDPLPATSGTSTVKTASTTSSLPFTGADVAELAVIGTGAVLAGGLLARRRRRAIA
jgi:LPXTG-motif cell wall-anchored protein